MLWVKLWQFIEVQQETS